MYAHLDAALRAIGFLHEDRSKRMMRRLRRLLRPRRADGGGRARRARDRAADPVAGAPAGPDPDEPNEPWTAVELTRALKDRARALGFDARRRSRAAQPLERDGAALAAWLAEDRHARMAWMAREPDKRADPEALLPGCRSVVALADELLAGRGRAPASPGAARVALYAHGRDYHRVLGEKLKRARGVASQESGGAGARTFVDTGPVLERAWAERAGPGVDREEREPADARRSARGCCSARS